MELFLLIGFIWFVIWVIQKAKEGSDSSTTTKHHLNRSQGSSGTGRGNGIPALMKELEVRIKSDVLGAIPHEIKVQAIQIRGLFPVKKTTDVHFIVSIFDQGAGGEQAPVFSTLEEFQEPGGVAFQSLRLVEGLKPGYGYSDWVTVGLIVPSFLVTPVSGRRSLQVWLRMVDANADYPIVDGLSNPSYRANLIWTQQLKLDVRIREKGYVEAEEDQLKARLLAVRLAIAVSMSDGLAHPKEAGIVRDWVARHLQIYSAERREEVKRQFNQEIENAFSAAKAKTLNLYSTCIELDGLGLVSLKYEAMELCYDVMAADGIAAKEELDVLRTIAKALVLDEKKLETIRDKRLTGLNLDGHADQEAANVLGIQPGWGPDQIKSHLRKEFTKWNNRLTTLPEGLKREQAQKMLDLIGQERKKYE